MTTNVELESVLKGVIDYDIREYGKTAYRMKEYILNTHPKITITSICEVIHCVSIPYCSVFGIDLKITKLTNGLRVIVRDDYGMKSGELLVSLKSDEDET